MVAQIYIQSRQSIRDFAPNIVTTEHYFTLELVISLSFAWKLPHGSTAISLRFAMYAYFIQVSYDLLMFSHVSKFPRCVGYFRTYQQLLYLYLFAFFLGSFLFCVFCHNKTREIIDE